LPLQVLQGVLRVWEVCRGFVETPQYASVRDACRSCHFSCAIGLKGRGSIISHTYYRDIKVVHPPPPLLQIVMLLHLYIVLQGRLLLILIIITLGQQFCASCMVYRIAMVQHQQGFCY
jgi:hypothetical protein